MTHQETNALERSSAISRVQMHLELYDESHRKWANKLLHFFGIPILTVSSLGLLAKLALSTGTEVAALKPNAGWVALALAALWYLWLDWRIGSATIVFLVVCYAVGSELSAGVLGILFGIGAVAHAVGHYAIEGKPPAVLSRPVALLEAPLWLVAICAVLIDRSHPKPKESQTAART